MVNTCNNAVLRKQKFRLFPFPPLKKFAPAVQETNVTIHVTRQLLSLHKRGKLQCNRYKTESEIDHNTW